jgi:hypothetical protein
MQVTCQDGRKRSLHGTSGSQYVYANGRRVYGYVIRAFSGDRFIASSTGKYRHLVAEAPISVGAPA